MSDDLQWLMDDPQPDRDAETESDAADSDRRHSRRPAFFLADPPRDVPRSVRLAVMFGGGLSQTGWWILAIGSLVGWFFVGQSDVLGPLRFRGELARATGRVTAVEKSGFSEGGGKHRRGRPVHRHDFEFVDPAGIQRVGSSYRAGDPYEVGREVTIRFRSDDPSIARIQGMRSKPLSGMAGIALVIPVAGAILAAIGFARGRRNCRLLSHGVAAEAVLKSKRDTGGKVNKKPIYRCEFEFTDRDKLQRTVIVSTHQLDAITDEPRERVLYDPADPRCAVLLDNLPGRPVIDEMGRIQAGPHTQTSGAVFAPLLAAAINGMGAWLMFR